MYVICERERYVYIYKERVKEGDREMKRIQGKRERKKNREKEYIEKKEKERDR